MADKPAQARKRKASSALRELAVELHITEKGRNCLCVGVFSKRTETLAPVCNRVDKLVSMFAKCTPQHVQFLG